MKFFKILLLISILLTSNCGLKQGYYSSFPINNNQSNNSSRLVNGTIITPNGMYMLNGITGNGMSSGSIIGPHGMTTYQFND